LIEVEEQEIYIQFDFKNILVGIIIGFLATIVAGALANDLYIDIRVGDIEKIDD